jgi:hypothetical protein
VDNELKPCSDDCGKHRLEHERVMFQQRVQAAIAAVPLAIIVGMFILDAVAQVTHAFAFSPRAWLLTIVTSATSAVVTYFFAQAARGSRKRKRLPKPEI